MSPEVIGKTFKSLNLKKTGDLWGMSVKVLNTIISNIAPYLTLICNNFEESGTFPDLLTYSKIVPLYKSGDRSAPGNYRLISVLPS